LLVLHQYLYCTLWHLAILKLKTSKNHALVIYCCINITVTETTLLVCHLREWVGEWLHMHAY
jgi:hypothetical protein